MFLQRDSLRASLRACPKEHASFGRQLIPLHYCSEFGAGPNSDSVHEGSVFDVGVGGSVYRALRLDGAFLVQL